jgi:hypothetical protein
VSRPGIPFLVALGVVIAAAVADLGAAARAGYQPVSVGSPAGVRLDAGMAAAPLPPSATWIAGKSPVIQTQQDVSDGGMTPPPSGNLGAGQSVGCVTATEPPPPNLVVYLGAADGGLNLPTLISSLLDPPRL